MFVLNASQCLNNLSINSIIAGLLSIRGVLVIVSYIGVRQSFLSVYSNLLSVLIHSFRVEA